MKWTNQGVMSLLSGCILSFRSTPSISNDINDVSVLPAADLNQSFVDSHQFKCHINDVSPILSGNKSYMQSIKLVSQITLLNRPFPGSKVATVIPCQYPIQITKIESPSSLSSHESAIVTVHFQNLSTRPYGMCSESAGSMAFHYSSHSLIHLTLIDKETSVPNFYQLNDSIAPKSTSSIRLNLFSMRMLFIMFMKIYRGILIYYYVIEPLNDVNVKFVYFHLFYPIYILMYY